LHGHIQFGRVDAARAVLERGLVIDPARMEQMVADAPNGPTLALLAQFGADLDGVDAAGVPRLIAAAMRGDMERLRDLLDAGAAPDIRGGPGNLSALEWAADRGDAFTASFLQERGVPGRVAVQTALNLIEDAAHPAIVALRGLYEGPTPFPHTGGFGPEDGLEFEGGLGDAEMVTIFVNNSRDLRAHVLERRGGDWALVRITPIDRRAQ
jgi:ankyrin repeat protein